MDFCFFGPICGMRLEQERSIMKIGQEHDPIEDLERDLLNAIADAANVRFQGENSNAEFARVQLLSRQRLNLKVEQRVAA